MKRLILLIQLFIIISCSTDDNDSGSDSRNDKKLVKKEYVSNNYKLEYQYNTDDLLTQINLVILKESINSQESFKYDDNNNIIERLIESENSNNYTKDTYSYDSNNRLTGTFTTLNWASITNKTKVISYDNNTITITSSPYKNIINLETNISGLITKMITTDFYSIIIYDSNDNISEISTFDNDYNLKFNHIYSYDNKPNPFYGQKKSLYILSFISAMSDANYGEIVYDGFEGYWFPFLKNNITTKVNYENNGNNYSYKYDDENYPINVIEKSLSGSVYKEYDIEYFN